MKAAQDDGPRRETARLCFQVVWVTSPDDRINTLSESLIQSPIHCQAALRPFQS